MLTPYLRWITLFCIDTYLLCMAAKVVNSLALENCSHPTLAFDVEIDFTEWQQAFVGVEGWLKTEAGLYVTNLCEVVDQSKPMEPLKLAARESAFDRQHFKPSKFHTRVIAQLDPMSLEALEDARGKDPKKNLLLKLELVERTVEATASVAHLQDIDPSQTSLSVPFRVMTSSGRSEDCKLVGRVYDSGFSTVYTNGWVISGDNGPSFLQVKILSEECSHKISASDWINDFAPKLKLGKFVTVEIPAEGELFDKAAVHLAKADEAFLRWDTKGVFSSCREVGSLLDGLVKREYGKDSFTYKERWGRAYTKHFENWASLDLHNEDLKGRYPSPEQVKLERPDSECLLMSTKLLVKFAQELLKEKNT